LEEERRKKKEMRGEGNRVRGRKRKQGGILLCLLLASLRFFLARKESEASSLVRNEEERKEKEMRGKGNRGRGRKREEEEEGRNFVVLTSGLSALLLCEERVGGLQPCQEAAQALHLS
jgi:hypothetical protein